MNPRGQNDLLDTAYRDLGRAAFRADLIFTALILGAIGLLWCFA